MEFMRAQVERIARERFGSDWADRCMVANIASILDGRGYGSVQDVPSVEFEEVLADNVIAAGVCDACWDSGEMLCDHEADAS